MTLPTDWQALNKRGGPFTAEQRVRAGPRVEPARTVVQRSTGHVDGLMIFVDFPDALGSADGPPSTIAPPFFFIAGPDTLESQELAIEVGMPRDVPRGSVVLRGGRVVTMKGHQVIENADLAIVVARRLKSDDVLHCLTELFALHGPPEHIRSDNGPEFAAIAMRGWLGRVGVKTLFIEPGSPWENGYIESFNGRLRDELVNGEIFTTLYEAQVLIERWRRHYNTVRPHSSLGYRPPAPETILPPAFDLSYASLRPAQTLALERRLLT